MSSGPFGGAATTPPIETEIRPDLLRRVLGVLCFDYCGELFWRVDNGVLRVYADCSDFFDWGSSDCEQILTVADVELLERCMADLKAATGEKYPQWVTDLYAARRRDEPPASFMLSGKHQIEPAASLALFPASS